MQKDTSMKAILVATFGLAGCLIHGPHVPTDLQGTIPVRIANRTSDPICAVAIIPYQSSAGAVKDNWLGDGFRQQPIAPGAEREFKIKAGSYRVGVGACNFRWGAGTQQGKLEIASATYIAIGAHAEGPEGFRSVDLPVVAAQVPQGGGAPAGEEAAAPAEGDQPAESDSSSESSDSSPSSEESSSSEESPSAPAAAPRDCKPLGAAVNSSNDCCSGATKLTPDGTKNICCDHETDSACS